MRRFPFPALLFLAVSAHSQDDRALRERAQRYLIDLIRIDTTNPPGNETRVARYLKTVADAEGIPSEVLGGDPARMNFVARLKAAGRTELKPLLLMAHSDVVPADPSQWTVPAFSGEVRDGYILGRGAQDDKSLLAAELAVLVELKRRAVKLNRDVILLSEADEEAGSLGIQWLIKNAWDKIDAEFAVNEGGFAIDVHSGKRLFQIQTSEKIPTRVILTARGRAGHGSLPRADNPVVHLARAITRIAEAGQPVRLNTTTRRYFAEMSKLSDHNWLSPLLPKLENGRGAIAAANEIRAREPEFEALLRTTVSPSMLSAGMKINVIPNTAQAHVDVRRLPEETRDEVMARFRKTIDDPAVDVSSDAGQDMPSTEPSSLTTTLYQAMERVFTRSNPAAAVIPYMSRGATDGSYLRQKGMAVYGAALFLREGESRAHGNDERLSTANLAAGTMLLWDVVGETAGAGR